jgi:deazaflavin-dependent oxidoreductase (nitroreductase family)
MLSADKEKKIAKEDQIGMPHVPKIVPIFNNVTRALLRLGVPMGPATLLEVRGRKSGKIRRQPVGTFDDAGKKYLFSTFGATNWVRNIRAAKGLVSIGIGRKRRVVVAFELSPEEAAPIIKRSIAASLASPMAKMILGAHIKVALDAPLSDYVEEARSHPVFEIREA